MIGVKEGSVPDIIQKGCPNMLLKDYHIFLEGFVVKLFMNSGFLNAHTKDMKCSHDPKINNATLSFLIEDMEWNDSKDLYDFSPVGGHYSKRCIITGKVTRKKCVYLNFIISIDNIGVIIKRLENLEASEKNIDKFQL